VFTLNFWRDAVERAVKTFAQSALALILAAKAASLLDIDWGNLFAVAGLAALISVLTSLGSVKFGAPGTASMAKVEPPKTEPTATAA
jgi:di/tricarboxylate transporter